MLELIEFARDVRLESMPGRVVDHARLSLLDFLALSVSGAQEEATKITRVVAIDSGATSQAQLLGFGDRIGVIDAALVAGVSSHVDDFDDTHHPTILHPTTPVFAAAVPVAQWLGASGRALLEAYVVGVEIACRLALALGGEHYMRGWHVTGTAGVVGAAAAAARLMDLEQGRFSNALGVAATSASGHREQFGTMTKSYHAGAAASTGVRAAMLASKGFTASPSSIDGNRGMLRVMSAESDPTRLCGALGESWELDRVGFKPYSCGVVTHGAIDAAVQLRDVHGLTPHEVEGIVLKVHPMVHELTGKVAPATGLEGKFSVSFVAALGLSKGIVVPSLFTDDVASDPDLVDLQRRIESKVDHALSQDQAVATATLVDGRIITATVDAARGTIGQPMTRSDVERKAANLVDPILGATRSTELIALCCRVEDLGTIDELVGATFPAP